MLFLISPILAVHLIFPTIYDEQYKVQELSMKNPYKIMYQHERS